MNDYFASGGMDNKVCVYDIKKGNTINILKGHTKWITDIKW